MTLRTTYSMTAYAQAATQTELGELSCELRTVNHRFLEGRTPHARRTSSVRGRFARSHRR